MVPQAVKVVRERTAAGISGGYLTMWFLGLTFSLWYTLLLPIQPWPIIVGYVISYVNGFVILWYKLTEAIK